MLNSHIPQPGRPDLRGWEWYYYFSLCHKELMSLRGNKRMESVAWSADGNRIASGDLNGTIQIWDAATGREILKFSADDGSVYSVAWSPNGKRLATGSRTARVWDAATGKEIFKFGGFESGASSVAWSPDGENLAAGDGWITEKPATVKVWDANTGKEIFDLKGKARYPVAWSPDSKRLAAGKGDQKSQTFQILDALSGRELHPSLHKTAMGSLPWLGARMESNWPQVSLTGRRSGM